MMIFSKPIANNIIIILVFMNKVQNDTTLQRLQFTGCEFAKVVFVPLHALSLLFYSVVRVL